MGTDSDTVDRSSRRWDIDERGHGIASGEIARPDLARLDAALAGPDWIAEEPDAHLLPHIRRACEVEGSGLEVVGWAIEAAILVVRLRETEIERGSKVDRRRRLLTVVGAFVEPSTFLRFADDDRILDIATGVLDGDGPFRGHGHLVRLQVVG